MSGASIIVLTTLLPCIFFIWLLNYLVRLKKVPRILLFKLFAAGMVTPLIAVILEGILMPLISVLPQALQNPAEAFIGIAVPEEAVKFAALLLTVRRRREFGTVHDGAVYGISLGMGFALLENILYVIGSDTPMATALMRGVSAIPLHALVGAFIGLMYARYRIKAAGSLSLAYLIAVAIHGSYDLILISRKIPNFLILPLLIVGWWFLIRYLNRVGADKELSEPHFP